LSGEQLAKKIVQPLGLPAHTSLTVGTLGNIMRAESTHKEVSREVLLESIL